MFATSEKEKLIDLTETYGPLTKTELAAYFSKTRDKDPEETKHVIKQLVTNFELFGKEEIVKASPNAAIDTKKMLAFWIYIAFAKETEDKMFKAKYPGMIGFVKDNVFIITVCEDGSVDNEMIALREKEKDYVTYIIGGLNMAIEDINKDLLPKEPFIYAEIRIENLLTDIPKITFTKVNEIEEP